MKKGSKIIKKTSIIVAIFLVIVLILYYFQYIINPVIYSISEGQIRTKTIRAVNNAIGKVVANVNIYDSLCNVITDEYGNISMISANALRINSITKELLTYSQDELDKLMAHTVKIPLGNFSGIPLLSGLGPYISIRVVPMGSMSCYFVSQFSHAGINQTNHRIYVNFESCVNIVMPLESRTITTKSQILICECIIVGKVPDTYLETKDGEENLLDLIPERQ